MLHRAPCARGRPGAAAAQSAAGGKSDQHQGSASGDARSRVADPHVHTLCIRWSSRITPYASHTAHLHRPSKHKRVYVTHQKQNAADDTMEPNCVAFKQHFLAPMFPKNGNRDVFFARHGKWSDGMRDAPCRMPIAIRRIPVAVSAVIVFACGAVCCCCAGLAYYLPMLELTHSDPTKLVTAFDGPQATATHRLPKHIYMRLWTYFRHDVAACHWLPVTPSMAEITNARHASRCLSMTLMQLSPRSGSHRPGLELLIGVTPYWVQPPHHPH